MEATSLDGGLDADKAAAPGVRDVYAATDTEKVYVCFTAGTWTEVPASLNIVTHSEPAKALDTEYQNTTDKIKLVVVTVLLEIVTSDNNTLDGIAQASLSIGAVSGALGVASTTRLRCKDVSIVGAGDLMSIRGVVSAFVPKDWYYEVVTAVVGDGQAVTLEEWHEYDLH